MIVQYSVFGSVLSISAMVGAVVSGKLADYIGRRGVSFIIPSHFLVLKSLLVISSSQ